MHRLIAISLIFVAVPLSAQRPVYEDALGPGFQDWSWATVDLQNTDPVAVGQFSVAMEPDGWGGLFFHADTPLDLTEWGAVRFWIHGGPAGGQAIRLYLQLGASDLGEVSLEAPSAGTWEQRTVDFGEAGMDSGFFDGLIYQDTSGVDQETVYFDQIELLPEDDPPPPPSAVNVTVDPNADRSPISPGVYGVNFGDSQQVEDLEFPVRRWGGNSTTRYNWQADVSNKASDWFFFNIANEVADPDALPHGSAADVFIDETLAAAGEPLLTVPTIGWTPLPERVKKWGFSVADYGPQLLTECTYFDPPPPPWCQPDAGDGTCDPAVNQTGYCTADGLIVGNDPTDTSQAVGATFVTDWMTHVASRVGTAGEGGARLWALDNEPMLWNHTHRDVHPEPLTYDDLWSRTVDIASAIKAQDPGAVVLGPAVWGWCAFFTSASDAAEGPSCVDGPDRQAHGGLPLLAWYLQQVCQYEADFGIRLVDLLDVHFYPQGGVSGVGSDTGSEDPVTAARRLRSVRELWDPTYVSESWIGEPVFLVPRLRDWIDTYCPGTGLALTEYKWGADDGTSGALAQAEVLAVLGREGVDLATRWVAPETSTRTEDAFRLFLDYDGLGSKVVGDTVRATSADVEAVGAYAVVGEAARLWLLVINKETATRDIEVEVTGGLRAEAPAPVFRFDGANPLAFVGSIPVVETGLSLSLPPRSASLIELRLPIEDLLFGDGFESGDTSAWSFVSP